jgi:hypothetical protein
MKKARTEKTKTKMKGKVIKGRTKRADKDGQRRKTKKAKNKK